MSRPDRTSNDKPYYVLDLSYRAKARGLALSAGAGGAAAVTTKFVFGFFLPEALAVVLCAPAFAEAADATLTKFNASLKPGDIVMRERRPPRIQL